MKAQRWIGWLVIVTTIGCSKPTPPPPIPPTGAGPQPSPGASSSPTGSASPGAESARTEPAAPPTTAASADKLPRLATEQIFVLPAANGASDEKLSVDEIKKMLDDPKNHEPFVPESPVGLGDVASFIPADNPMTRAKVELGRMLYFDKRLSRDSSVSCASCHDPAAGWAQNTPVAAGIDGQKGGRNSPTVMNRIFGDKGKNTTQFWDGRAASLEEQALGPIQNPIEMGFTLDELVERLNGIEGYRLCFEKIFGKVSSDGIAKSIASFERTVLVAGSPFDYYAAAEPFRKLTKEDLEGDPELAAKAKQLIAAADAHALSEAAERGRALFFGKAECKTCHVGANLADEAFYNIGVGVEGEKPDPGRKEVTKADKDTGAFKTPTVRNVALNAPYMHDGSQKTLMEVVEHYAKGGTPNPHLSNRIKKLDLSDAEKSDLVAFMEQGLTGPMPKIEAPRLP
jgi:cytochrome c peroxidase